MIRWALTVLIELDEFVNALTGGYANETISRRMAFSAARGKFAGCLFCKLIEKIWPRHCDLSVPSKAEELSRIRSAVQSFYDHSGT